MNEILILFGTQTGTAEDLATELEIEFDRAGLKARCENMFDVSIDELKSKKRIYFIVSTWGDGDPPDDAEDFFRELCTLPSGFASSIEFAVFGLGDTSYDYFCQFGKDMDFQLKRIGGKRMRARVDCDEDYADIFDEWADSVVKSCKSLSIENSKSGRYNVFC